MWIILGLTLTVLALTVWYFYNKQQLAQTEAHFDQILGLRQLIQLLRQHRRLTHSQLMKHSEMTIPEWTEQDAIQHLSNQLVSQASLEQKPMYRILHQNLQQLANEWPRYSLSRNQAIHGKSIRHAMYLIDDHLTTSMLLADRPNLFEQYQQFWPVTLNALDTLAQFRATVGSFHPENHKEEILLRRHLHLLQRRLGQMNLMLKVPGPSLMADQLEQDLTTLLNSTTATKACRLALYKFSLSLSDHIFYLFDAKLMEIAHGLSIEDFPNDIQASLTPLLAKFSHEQIKAEPKQLQA
ncbi:hypothetical protein KDD30_04185 [Photobacterium sp. GJ3]|uniref:hypothetical protein n=1 Tax=Photobacterium sp. GJ3 TaxID=2829502 RepID=UPI001B8CAC25|nr:hypothetical protein [Photobacterium sp. GJ3]QUJ68338.1 hypothetical protein KDD30_04185 [Photobacterium sp. GJ3]